MRSTPLLALTLIILALLVVPVSSPSPAPNQTPAVISQQPTSSTPYMAVFKVQANSTDPTPFVLYPASNKTVWIVTAKFGPLLSQIVNFTLGAQPKVVLTLPNTIPASIVVDKLGNVWFPLNDTLVNFDPRVDPVTLQTAATYTGGSPTYLAVDAQNRMWLTLTNSNKIAMYDPSNPQNGRFFDVPTPTSLVQGIAVAPDGTIWFVETGAKKLARLDPGAANITEFSFPFDFLSPVQVAIDRNGMVWSTSHGTNQFGSFNPQTGEWRTYPVGYCPESCSIGLPNAIAVDSQGKIWFSEHIGGRIARLDPESLLLTEYIIPIPPGSPGSSFAFPWWASPGSSNLVWFTAFGFGEIGYVNASVPVPFTISTEREITVQRGFTSQLAVAIDHQNQGVVSVGVSPSLEYFSRDPLISGSFIQNIPVGGSLVKVTIGITAAWDAPEEPRVVMITASDGQVAVSVPVKVNVVQPVLLYVALAGASSLLVAGVVLYVRRRRKRADNSPHSKNAIEPPSPENPGGG